MKHALLLFFLATLALAAAEPTPTPEPLPRPRGMLPTPLTGVANWQNLHVLKTARNPKVEHPFSRRDLGLETPRITAMRVVRLTLDFNPQVALQRENVRDGRGAVEVERGTFDTHLTGEVALNGSYNERRMRYRGEILPAPTPFPNPLRQRQSVLEYEVGLQKRLANGVVINPTVRLSHRFESDYGGTFSDRHEAKIGFAITIPLAKGSGVFSNKAPEIAARFDLQASMLQLRFITSRSVAGTLKAFWATKAAEETYRLRVESEEIALRLLKIGTSLVEGGELSPAELVQLIADHSTTVAHRVQAETALILSRQTLASATGIPASSILLAPLAADPFPLPGSESLRFPGEQRLISTAYQLRDDLRAARQLVASRKVLMDAAYLNLRPTVNLRLSGLYLPFQTRDQSTVTPGGHQWQAGAELTLDWPLENQSAHGQYVQSQAAFEKSRIDIADAERMIASEVIAALSELKGAAANVRLLREGIHWYREALLAQEELFALGQGNLTDTITARRRLVEAQISHVAALQSYATSLVQLRFATGLLLFADEKTSWIDSNVWNVVPFSQEK